MCRRVIRAITLGLGLVVGAVTLPGTVAGVCIACSTRREPVDVDAVLEHMDAVAAAVGEA